MPDKTVATHADIAAFIETVEPARRRAEASVLLGLMSGITGMEPRMWGPSIIGFGRYAYRYDSGRSGESFLTGFAPRKAASVVYVMPGFKPYEAQLACLGPHKHSVSCLYLSNLQKNDLSALEEIIADSVERMKSKYEWREV